MSKFIRNIFHPSVVYYCNSEILLCIRFSNKLSAGLRSGLLKGQSLTSKKAFFLKKNKLWPLSLYTPLKFLPTSIFWKMFPQSFSINFASMMYVKQCKQVLVSKSNFFLNTLYIYTRRFFAQNVNTTLLKYTTQQAFAVTPYYAHTTSLQQTRFIDHITNKKVCIKANPR